MMFSPKIGFFSQQGTPPPPVNYYFNLFPGYTYLSGIEPINNSGSFNGSYIATGYTSATDTPPDSGLLYRLNKNGTYQYVVEYDYSATTIPQTQRVFSQGGSGGNPCRSGTLIDTITPFNNKILWSASVLGIPSSGWVTTVNSPNNMGQNDAKTLKNLGYVLSGGFDGTDGYIVCLSPGGNAVFDIIIPNTTQVLTLGSDGPGFRCAFNSDNIFGPDYVSSGVVNTNAGNLFSKILLNGTTEDITARGCVVRGNDTFSVVSGNTSHDSTITWYFYGNGALYNQYTIASTDVYDGFQQFYVSTAGDIYFIGYKYVGGYTHGIVGKVEIVSGNPAIIWVNELYCPGYNFTPTFIAGDDSFNALLITAETDYNGVASSVIVRIPDDGSLTATYGPFEYQPTAITIINNNNGVVYSNDPQPTVGPGYGLNPLTSWSTINNLTPTNTVYT